MVEVNLTLLAFIFVAIFAMSGFFKGWWKEAITTFFLAILVFLLQQPELAAAFIASINWVLDKIWQVLGAFPQLLDWVNDFLQNTLGVELTNGVLQLDPTDASTWLVIMLLSIGLSIFISRAALRRDIRRAPASFYTPTILGSLLGGLLGAFNGFLIINLVREYLDGRALPGGTATAAAAELTRPGTSAFGVASSGLAVEATDLPSFTVLDSLIPWVIILVGFLLLVTAIGTRVSRDGMNVRAKEQVLGYNGIQVVPKKEKKEES